MQRIHLFEFEDLPWFPARLRNYMTDFLSVLANRFDMYKGAIPLIKKGLEQSKSQHMIDLASGGGGGLLKICEHLKAHYPELKITLTDLYPNTDYFMHMSRASSCFDYVAEPVDATQVPAKLRGLRTLFLSFHHFTPDMAKKILQNTVDQRACIGIFEAQERSLPSLAAMFFSPITLLLLTPMIRPFKFSRILFTYLIPILPVLVWWDGMVSSLRTYSVQEMQALINQLEQKESFNWEVGKVKSGPGVILYLLAYPKEQ